MLKDQKIVARRKPRPSRAYMLPADVPRCFGHNCNERMSCKRYTQVVYENNCSNAQKGRAYSVNMRIGHHKYCVNKIEVEHED